VNRLLRRASGRFYLRHPWQLALAVAGISLGVAVYVGVALANDGARRAFEQSAALVRGQTTHRLLPVSGALDERIYRDLVVDRGVTAAAPVIETEVQLLTAGGGRYPLLGIDPLSESGLRGFSGFSSGAGATRMAALIASPRAALVPDELARAAGKTAGTTLRVAVMGRAVELNVIGTVSVTAGRLEAEPPIVVDIATAQELLGRPGALSRIDLRLTDGQAARLAANQPRGTVLVPAEETNSAFAELSSAFRTNLTALGLLALVVGMFLIYGTMSFAVVQRRSTLGVLSALGASRTELLTTILLEAAVLGVIATSAGLVLGHFLAAALIGLVLQTIGDLYFTAAVTAATPSPWIYVVGAGLGFGATVLAAVKPAFDAARAGPTAAMRRADLERRSRHGVRRATRLALVFVIGAGVLLVVSSRSLFLAFGALFLVLAAGALSTPAATIALMRISEWPAERLFRLPGILAVRSVTASLSRTGVATAALAVAIATVIGIGLMIASFRASLMSWLDTTLTADVYVALAPSGVVLDDEMLEKIRALPGVGGITLTRNVQLPTTKGDVAVRAFEPDAGNWGLDLTSGATAETLAALSAGRGAVISERYAFGAGLDVGDVLELPSGRGIERLPVLGIFRDYNTGPYTVVMSLDAYASRWSDRALTGLGIRLAAGVDSESVERALRGLLGSAAVRMRSSDAIERLSMGVFDRTFKITEVLRVLAAVVAFLGVMSALLSIELERAHELAVLRALGFEPRQITVTLLTQTGLLGVAAGLAAVPIGVVLAALLVHVINQRSFGWSMDLIVGSRPVLAGVALAVVAALLAGVYPALRAGRAELGGALREE
jgi:putative ABC transport system permease protein